EGVVGDFVFVVVSNVSPFDDDEIRLTLSVMTEGAGSAIISIEAGHITNIEVEQRRMTVAARAVVVTERVGAVAVGGVNRGVLWVVSRMFSGGFRACEHCRKVVVGGPLAEVI